MRLDADAVIVGGSVAGAATAAFLARRGRSSVIVDRVRFPRDKPCGEGLMPHGVDLLAELGVLEEVRRAGAAELSGVRYTLDSGATVADSFPALPGRSSVALGVRRLQLDQVLLDFARRAANVNVNEGFAVREVIFEGGTVVGVSDGERAIGGRVVVGADGLRSRVRTALGWDASHSRPRRYAVVGHFRLPAGQTLAPEIEVVLCPAWRRT